MPTPPALSLKAIAAQAGVSTMSVSRALNNSPGISVTLREKILRIAQERKYRPNPLITALMSNLRVQRSQSDRGTAVAFLERADRAGEARTEHLAGARQAAEEQGYKLEALVVGKVGLSAARVDNILRARNISGVLIAPLPEAHGHFDLEWSHLCAVVIEYTFSAPVFDRVVHDFYNSMRLALTQCRARGFRRIGLAFTNNGRERTERLNEAAYWAEQKLEKDMAPLPPLALEKWDARLASQWLDRHRPEVIVTSNVLWPHLLGLLHQRRLRVPRDISMLNINLYPQCQPDCSSPPGLASLVPSGINTNSRLIGATGMRLLIDKINRNDRGVPEFPNTVLTPGSWFEGDTFGQPRPRAMRK